MKKKDIILIGILFLCFNIYAQTKNITIKVTDVNNKPVAGAIILFDDVRQKRWTNSDGIFKAKFKQVPKEISAFHPKIGLKKTKYYGTKKLFIKIKAGDNLFTNNDNPKSKILKSDQFNTIYDYLRGRFPGVNITSDNEITIRGYNTVNGNMTPLFILDGINVDQNTFGSITPSQIKSVRILKGPEIAAYGVRGANGVIIVKTM